MTMQWKIGDVRITKVVEHELPIPLNGLLVGVADEVIARNAWLAPDFVTPEGLGKLSIHALVIDTGERRILVDTCVGNLREGLVMPPLPSDLPASLAEAGYAVDDIDTVICTHLHFDHVGWNTRLEDGKWVVTFPNARYLIGRAEWEHWQVTQSEYGNNLGDTVQPLVDAGAADFVETDYQVCAQVRLTPTPGHTPGHVSVVIDSGGQRAVITGDMAHHPIQFSEPDIAAPADSDSPQAARTRRAFLAEREADGALVIGTHFGGPTAGQIVAEGDAWRLVPRLGS
ncbi:MAG: ytnP [Mycobacterium sp.]|jgi:glyoxylase-like metal-dependent hydrolase (beta-lactamase superfamily II)|nr:ytnP [Mycobacterium sp.]